MKVKVRTVNNVTFEVEVPEDATVSMLNAGVFFPSIHFVYIECRLTVA